MLFYNMGSFVIIKNFYFETLSYYSSKRYGVLGTDWLQYCFLCVAPDNGICQWPVRGLLGVILIGPGQ